MCAMVKVVAILGMGDLQPLIGNPYNGYYINPYYWVDDHPLLYGNNGSLDPGTCIGLLVGQIRSLFSNLHWCSRVTWGLTRYLGFKAIF